MDPQPGRDAGCGRGVAAAAAADRRPGDRGTPVGAALRPADRNLPGAVRARPSCDTRGAPTSAAAHRRRAVARPRRLSSPATCPSSTSRPSGVGCTDMLAAGWPQAPCSSTACPRRPRPSWPPGCGATRSMSCMSSAMATMTRTTRRACSTSATSTAAVSPSRPASSALPRPRPAAAGLPQRVPVRTARRRGPVPATGPTPGPAGLHGGRRHAVPHQRRRGHRLHRRVLCRALRTVCRSTRP